MRAPGEGRKCFGDFCLPQKFDFTTTRGRHPMTDDDNNNEGQLPFMQRLLDNPFILLFIGIAVPTLTYIVWGIMELISIPLAP